MRKLRFLIFWLSLSWVLPIIPVLAQPPTPPPPDAAAVLAEARRVEEHAQNQVSLIVTLMEIFIGVVALVTIILIGIGLREWKNVSEKAESTLKSAEAAAQRAQETADKGQTLVATLEKETDAARQKADVATRLAEESSQQIKEMRTSLVEAWSSEIHTAFHDLPDLEAEWEFAFKVRELPPEARVRIVDLDALCVICDRLKIPGDLEKLVDSLLQMGRYWRFVDEYPRAMVRVDRALALASTNASAEKLEGRCRLHRARVFIQWVTYKPGKRRDQHLTDAKGDLDRIRQIQGGDDSSTLFEDAWIADLEERYDDALELWARAREAEVSEGKPEGLWRYGYNAACTLTRANRMGEAIGELRQLVGQGTKWILLATGDPDLDQLRTHPEWGQKLEVLLEEARQASGN